MAVEGLEGKVAVKVKKVVVEGTGLQVEEEVKHHVMTVNKTGASNLGASSNNRLDHLVSPVLLTTSSGINPETLCMFLQNLTTLM